MISRTGATTVLVSGATGKLGQAVYAALVDSPSYDVLPFTLGRNLGIQQINDRLCVEVLDEPGLVDRLGDIKGSGDPELVVVDCTTKPQWQTASMFAFSLALPTIIMGKEGNEDSDNEKEFNNLLGRSDQFGSLFTVLLVPNACLPIVGLLEAFEAIEGRGRFLGLDLGITESAPSSDDTALEIAHAFKNALEGAGSYISAHIFTEQRPKVQQIKWGLPEAYLDNHAVYKIQLHGSGVAVNFEIRVMGYESHALGLRDVILPEFIGDYLGNQTTGVRNY